MGRDVIIFDTTLRDGKQAPGNSMTAEEKMRLARQLDTLGVEVIEAGFRRASGGDRRAVRAIAEAVRRPVIAALARCHDRDIDLAGEAVRPAARPRVHVFIATSDLHLECKLRLSRDQCLERAREAVQRARRYTDDVEFSAEDATRTDLEFLCRVVEAAIAAGATTINLPDTVGYALPVEYGAMFRAVHERVPNADRVVFSAHCHDDLGLAVANSLAAIEAGAGQVECTVNGIGERAGNAALEEIVVAGRVRPHAVAFHCGVNPQELYRTSQLLSHVIGVFPQPNKAVVGRNAFAHEAGIHQHGVLQNGLTYEIIRPEEVGVARSSLVLGKHSGRHALERRYSELGYEVDDATLRKLYDEFTTLADKKREILDEDLLALLHGRFHDAPEVYRLAHLQVTCGTVSATAEVRLAGPWNGAERGATAVGNGPIAAAFAAIAKVVGRQVDVLNLTVQSVTPGRDSLGQHEQAAAHAADGYARASGRVGVCVATSGPGATNLVTGLAAAYMDSSPVVAITGQVSRPMIGRDAFQETDIVGITLPITKQNYLVEDVTDLADIVAEAMAIAVDGRPGPVLIDVPKDVQNQKIEWRGAQASGAAPHRDPRAGARGQSLTPGASPGSLEDGVRAAARLIAGAERPLLMVGHGVILSEAYAEVRTLAEKTGIPVITTLLGISAFPDGHPLHLGMPGMHGEVHVNRAIQNADVIVGIGLRFDDRVTGNTASFAPQARIVHIDLDRAEIGKNVPVAVGIVGDARDITRRLVAAVEPRRCERWVEHIRGFVRTDR